MGFYTEYRQKLLDTGVLTPEEAKAFFEDLYNISRIRISEEVGDSFSFYFPTKQYCGPGGFSDTANGWLMGQPLGICDHSTATDSHRSALKWFSSYSKWTKATGIFGSSNASSCFVIALSGEPFLLIDFWNGKADWHEPELNGLTIGIEHVNCGELRKDGSNYCWWPSGWLASYAYTETLPPTRVDYKSMYWMQPYTKAQILTNLIIKRAFVCLYSTADDSVKPRPELFVDHETYSDDRTDQGPLWPLVALRAAAFSTEPIKYTTFYADFVEESDIAGTDSISEQVLHTAMARFGKMPLNMNARCRERSKIITVQQSLSRLGYTTPISGSFIDSAYISCVKQFQLDNNLPVDGIAGSVTRSVILNKLVEKDKSLS